MREIRPTKEGKWPILGNGAPFRGQVALGNMTQYKMTLWHCEDGLVIAIDERGAYSFNSYSHWAYVQDKLGLKYEGDARNIADLINDQFRELCDRQGEYNPQLCRD
jgi:hypothetical protein